jgi:hypothetical protein
LPLHIRLPRACFLALPGRKSVLGGLLQYTFGTAAKAEIIVTGNAERGNVFYREDRFAGMEYPLRFASGVYSYIVYNMDGNVERVLPRFWADCD